MKKLNNNEMMAVDGGKKTYYYSSNPWCSYYTSGNGAFSEAAAVLKLKAHMVFCSLCTSSGRKVWCGYSLPSKCR